MYGLKALEIYMSSLDGLSKQYCTSVIFIYSFSGWKTLPEIFLLWFFLTRSDRAVCRSHCWYVQEAFSIIIIKIWQGSYQSTVFTFLGLLSRLCRQLSPRNIYHTFMPPKTLYIIGGNFIFKSELRSIAKFFKILRIISDRYQLVI